MKKEDKQVNAKYAEQVRRHGSTWNMTVWGCRGRIEHVYDDHVKEVEEERRKEGKSGRNIEAWRQPSTRESRLEVGQKMGEERMMVIAIARWISQGMVRDELWKQETATDRENGRETRR